MSLRGKRDIPATEARDFHCGRSFIRLGDGAEILFGRDWRERKEEVGLRDNWKCRGCGRMVCDPHHIVPRGKGGSDNMENLLSLCRNCHNKQHPEKQVRWSTHAPQE